MSKNSVQDKDLTIQEQLIELSEKIAWFQSDEFALEDAVKTYTEAEALAKDIEDRLTGLKNEITVIKQRFDS